MKVRVINGSENFWVEGDFTTYGELKTILERDFNINLTSQSISQLQLFGDVKPVYRAKKEGTTYAEDKVASSYVLPTQLGKNKTTGEVTHDFTIIIAEVENKLGAYSINTIKELRSKMRNLFNQAREAGVNQPLVNSTESLVETVVNELMTEQVEVVRSGFVTTNTAGEVAAYYIPSEATCSDEEEDERLFGVYDDEDSDIEDEDYDYDSEDESFEESVVDIIEDEDESFN